MVASVSTAWTGSVVNVRQDSRDPTVASVSNVGKREGGGGGRVEEEEEGSEVKGRGRKGASWLFEGDRLGSFWESWVFTSVLLSSEPSWDRQISSLSRGLRERGVRKRLFMSTEVKIWGQSDQIQHRGSLKTSFGETQWGSRENHPSWK